MQQLHAHPSLNHPGVSVLRTIIEVDANGNESRRVYDAAGHLLIENDIIHVNSIGILDTILSSIVLPKQCSDVIELSREVFAKFKKENLTALIQVGGYFSDFNYGYSPTLSVKHVGNLFTVIEVKVVDDCIVIDDVKLEQQGDVLADNFIAILKREALKRGLNKNPLRFNIGKEEDINARMQGIIHLIEQYYRAVSVYNCVDLMIDSTAVRDLEEQVLEMVGSLPLRLFDSSAHPYSQCLTAVKDDDKLTFDNGDVVDLLVPGQEVDFIGVFQKRMADVASVPKTMEADGNWSGHAEDGK